MKHILTLVLTLVFLAPAPLLAQTIRYMDESGNIFFVDSVDQVPTKYRDQLLPKVTPMPLDPKDAARQKKELEKEKKKAEKEKKKKEKEAAKHLKEEERRKQKLKEIEAAKKK